MFAPTTIPIPETLEFEQALIDIEGEILTGVEGKCPLCKKIFDRKTSLLNHIRNHSAEKKYICAYCQKGFSQQANLRNHTRIHTNDRPYSCNDCGKAFTQITNLNNHKRLHSGERPFVCIEIGCGRSFAQVTNLNNHMKTHHKIQQYVCTHCPQKFHTVTQLNHHLTTHGIVIKPQFALRGDYACNVCPTFFFDEIQLKRHKRKHTEGKKFTCDMLNCTEQFITKNQLNKHIQTFHPHEYCRKEVRNTVPISLLHFYPNRSMRYSPLKTKLKIEENIRSTIQKGISQFPVSLPGCLSSVFQQQNLSNDEELAALSITNIINRRSKAFTLE